MGNLPVAAITILRHISSNGCHLLAMNGWWNRMYRNYLQAFGQHLLCFLPLADEEILMNCATSGQSVPAPDKGRDIEDRLGWSGRIRNSKGQHWQSSPGCFLWTDIEHCRVLEGCWTYMISLVKAASRVSCSVIDCLINVGVPAKALRTRVRCLCAPSVTSWIDLD